MNECNKECLTEGVQRKCSGHNGVVKMSPGWDVRMYKMSVRKGMQPKMAYQNRCDAGEWLDFPYSMKK